MHSIFEAIGTLLVVGLFAVHNVISDFYALPRVQQQTIVITFLVMVLHWRVSDVKAQLKKLVEEQEVKAFNKKIYSDPRAKAQRKVQVRY